MIRLTNPYKSDNTKQTPIEMLLARMKQSEQADKIANVKEEVDRQYQMFKLGNTQVMLNTLHDSKFTKVNQINSKTNPIVQINNRGLDLKIKDQALAIYNKTLKKKNNDCMNGSQTACNYINNIKRHNYEKKKIIDNIVKKLTTEHNKKANNFNQKIQSQTKPNPLTKKTTSDYLINPETNKIIKNPVVSKLEQQKKLKDKDEALKNSDAYKKSQEIKKIETKMYKPKKIIKLNPKNNNFAGITTI